MEAVVAGRRVEAERSAERVAREVVERERVWELRKREEVREREERREHWRLVRERERREIEEDRRVALSSGSVEEREAELNLVAERQAAFDARERKRLAELDEEDREVERRRRADREVEVERRRVEAVAAARASVGGSGAESAGGSSSSFRPKLWVFFGSGVGRERRRLSSDDKSGFWQVVGKLAGNELGVKDSEALWNPASKRRAILALRPHGGKSDIRILYSFEGDKWFIWGLTDHANLRHGIEVAHDRAEKWEKAQTKRS